MADVGLLNNKMTGENLSERCPRTVACPDRSTPRPVVFLDVDGVLNAVGAAIPGPDMFTDFRRTHCMGFRIVYSPEMGRRLAGLDADIVWLTTWREMANKWIAPLFGWPKRELLDGDEDAHDDSAMGWWKSGAVYGFVTEHQRPFVWLDDDLRFAERLGEVEWLAGCAVPHLCISPSTTVGLRPSHLDLIEQFVAEHRH